MEKAGTILLPSLSYGENLPLKGTFQVPAVGILAPLSSSPPGGGEEGGGGGEGEEEGNDVIIGGQITNQPKKKDRATQPMDHGRLR